MWSHAVMFSRLCQKTYRTCKSRSLRPAPCQYKLNGTENQYNEYLASARGLPVPPVPPHFLLSFPITSDPPAILSNLLRCLSTSPDLSQTIATIADHCRRPHSLAQHRPALSQRPSKYGRLGTIP